jgi:phage replication initiation protein
MKHNTALYNGQQLETVQGVGYCDLPNQALAWSAGRGAGAVSVTEPPYTNRGVEMTKGAKSGLGVDYLSCTFPDGTTLEYVQQRFGGGEWQQISRGRMGYRSMLIRDHITILYDGSPGMGIHVCLKGQGCSQVEKEQRITDWPVYLQSLLGEAKLTRVDLACDDREGLLDLDQIESYANKAHVSTHFRKWHPESEKSLHTPGESYGKTLYFGKRQSSHMVRFYDKAAEQNLEVDETTGKRPHWIRVELETKGHDECQSLVQILGQFGLAEGFGGVMLALLDFKEPGQDSVKSRWDTAEWWSGFIHAVEKIRMSLPSATRSLATVRDWVYRQVAPNLALLLTASGGDIDTLLSIVENGRHRLKSRHLQLLTDNLLTVV